jgi:4-cresol dehydrogenase (hydroxylating)
VNDKSLPSLFAAEITRLFAKEDFDLSSTYQDNSLAIERRTLGWIAPRTLEQVQQLVEVAARCQIALYPVSTGKNIGYGDQTPYQADQVVVSLRHLNRIRQLDLENGEVVVEPGVTQGQLAAYLKEQNAPFWADMTGASPDASIIGNTLEAGFGHTPLGDHRKHILDMEVILADGTLLQTGEMPSVGPDLSQLFVQSNFGIVTALRIPLLPIPEKCLTFTITFDSDEKFFAGVTILKQLRKTGVLSSLVHSGNSTRTLMTASAFPQDCDPAQTLNEEQCFQHLNKNSFIRIGAWNSIGAIYGFSDEVQGKMRRLKKALKGVAQVRVFDDRKIERTEWLLNLKVCQNLKGLRIARKSFATLKALHGILRGEPSSIPSENIFWRVQEKENLGLAWFSPVIPATAEDASRLLEISRAIFAKHSFEMPVTLTLINEKKMTAVYNISFDKSNPEEVTRARRAYHELSSTLLSFGYSPYRLGILSDASAALGETKKDFLQCLKRALDPQNILAPGRYGIDQGAQPRRTVASYQNPRSSAASKEEHS